MMPVTSYAVETVSVVHGKKFSRNNGRNSKNIQRFPRVPMDQERRMGPRTVPAIRVRVKCPTPEAAASAILTLTILPETRTEESAWCGHECKPNTRECNQAPVYLGDTESVEGCVATVAFQPKKVWRYNHAMKKNLGRKRELHCLEYSVFQSECCVYTCLGPTFELENKKREQSSRKRRLREQGVASTASGGSGSTQSPKSEPSSITTDEKVEEIAYDVKRPTNKRRLEVEECMALDNTLATVCVADDLNVQFFDDPDLLFLRKGNSKRGSNEEGKTGDEHKLTRGDSNTSDDTFLSGSELMHAFDDVDRPLAPLPRAKEGLRSSTRRPGAGSVGSGRGSDTDGLTSDAGHTSDGRSDGGSSSVSYRAKRRRGASSSSDGGRARRASVGSASSRRSRRRAMDRSADASAARRLRTARARRQRVIANAPLSDTGVDDSDVEKVLAEIDLVSPPGGGLGLDPTGELPPVCAIGASNAPHVGSDGAAQYSGMPVGITSFAAGAGAGVPELRRTAPSARRGTRSSRYNRDNGATRSATRPSSRASSDTESRRTIRLVRNAAGEQVPVEIILPEHDGDEAPGCTTRGVLLASIAVLFLMAIIVSAAVLVFNHGKQKEREGGVLLDQADCVVSAWSAWSVCCNNERVRNRDVVTPSTGNGASCPSQLSQTLPCDTNSASCPSAADRLLQTQRRPTRIHAPYGSTATFSKWNSIPRNSPALRGATTPLTAPNAPHAAGGA